MVWIWWLIILNMGLEICRDRARFANRNRKHSVLGQTGESKANVARQIQMDGREPKNIAKFALPIVLEDPHGRVQGK